MADIFSQLLFRPGGGQAAGLQRSHVAMQATTPSLQELAKTNQEEIEIGHMSSHKLQETNLAKRSVAYAPPINHHSKPDHANRLDDRQESSAKEEEKKDTKPWFGDDGFTFLDFLDVINPLQNIPIVNTLYRQLSNDEMSKGARLMGGTLYGGPIGFVGALADISTEEATGRSISEHITGLFTADKEEARSVSCGHRHTLVLTDSGKVYGMGTNRKHEIGVGNSV